MKAVFMGVVAVIVVGLGTSWVEHRLVVGSPQTKEHADVIHVARRVWQILLTADADGLTALLAPAEEWEFYSETLGFSREPAMLMQFARTVGLETRKAPITAVHVLPRKAYSVLDVAVMQTPIGYVSVFMRISDQKVVKIFVEQGCCYFE